MALKFPNLPKLYLCLLLSGHLSGCELVAAVIYDQYQPPFAPEIKASTDDTITVKYRGVGPDVKHDEAEQLIMDHCGGPYIETNRKKLSGWITIDAECVRENDSSQG